MDDLLLSSLIPAIERAGGLLLEGEAVKLRVRLTGRVLKS
jgi:hypothetical protein